MEGCTQSGVLACSLERLLARAGGHLWASQGPRRGTPLSLRWGSRLRLPRACEADCEQLPQLLFLSPGSAQAVGSWQGEVVGGPLGSSGWIPCGRPQPCPLPFTACPLPCASGEVWTPVPQPWSLPSSHMLWTLLHFVNTSSLPPPLCAPHESTPVLATRCHRRL